MQPKPVPADLTTVESGVPEPMQGQDILTQSHSTVESSRRVNKLVAAGIYFPVRDFSDSRIVLFGHLSASKCSGLEDLSRLEVLDSWLLLFSARLWRV